MQVKSLWVCALFAVIILAGQQLSRAALIPGVSASTNMLAVNNTHVNNIINGSGLPGNAAALTGTHAYPNASNTWTSGYESGYVIFDLGGDYYIDGIVIWPFNGNNQVCVKDIQMLSSTNGSNYTTIPGAPTVLPQGPSAQAVNPIYYSVGQIQATHIRFNILSNYGYSSPSGWRYSGLAEVQFDGTPVPEPTMMALLMGGALLRRNKTLAHTATRSQ